MEFKACLFAKLDSISVKPHVHDFTGLHLSWDVSDLPVTHLPLFPFTVEAPPPEKDAYRGTRGHVCVPDSLDLCSTEKGSEMCYLEQLLSALHPLLIYRNWDLAGTHRHTDRAGTRLRHAQVMIVHTSYTSPQVSPIGGRFHSNHIDSWCGGGDKNILFGRTCF